MNSNDRKNWRKPIVDKKYSNYSKDFYEKDKAYLSHLEQKDERWFRDYKQTILKYTKKGDKILEVGCGTGLITSSLHKERPNMQGVDFSKRFIKRALKRGNYFKVMDATNLRFKKESFDAVCSIDLVEHIHDLPKALSEFNRILKKDGLLIIQSPNLLCNILSVNYQKSIKNIAKKAMFLFKDTLNPKLRTIDDYGLDVLTGDKDAYNLMSPIWLKKDLMKRGYSIEYLTTFALFFEPGKIMGILFKIASWLPFTKYIGGRMVIVGQKTDL